MWISDTQEYNTLRIYIYICIGVYRCQYHVMGEQVTWPYSTFALKLEIRAFVEDDNVHLRDGHLGLFFTRRARIVITSLL